MPDRIPVTGPELSEERRQLAEAIADLHYVVAIIVENGKELVPGEAVDELRLAWTKSEESFKTLVQNLFPPPNQTPPSPISDESLKAGQLTGEVGKIKRSLLARLKDRFFMFWFSEPRTDEKRAKAGEEACGLLEVGETLVSSIPGYEYVEEMLSLTRQLVGVRAKRGV